MTKTGALPAAVTFKDNGDGTATLSGKPAAGTAKKYPLTFTATNAVGTATQTFALTVYATRTDLALVKTVRPNGTRPGYLIYTLSVANTGPNAAKNLVMTDVLPKQVQYVGLTSAYTGTCAYTSTTRTIRCTVPGLAVGATWKLTVNVKWLSGDNATNCAKVTSGPYELNPENNQACVTHDGKGQVLTAMGQPLPAWANALVAWLRRPGA